MGEVRQFRQCGVVLRGDRWRRMAQQFLGHVDPVAGGELAPELLPEAVQGLAEL